MARGGLSGEKGGEPVLWMSDIRRGAVLFAARKRPFLKACIFLHLCLMSSVASLSRSLSLSLSGTSVHTPPFDSRMSEHAAIPLKG